MDLLEAIKQRHSVRQYLEKPIEKDIIEQLNTEIEKCNLESGLHLQLIVDEPKAFDTFLAHYGLFKGVKNYIAVVGNDEEACGYYGEHLVLLCQQLGLNTCWVALTYKKVPEFISILPHEKLQLVIALGYGKIQGKPHKSKSIQAVSNYNENHPEWFKKGVKAALMAPTAINQQKFKFIYNNGKVEAKAGRGPCTLIDLGIVKYHFEVGSGKDYSVWL